MPMKIVSLFSGAGGLDLGLKMLVSILSGPTSMTKLFGIPSSIISRTQY